MKLLSIRPVSIHLECVRNDQGVSLLELAIILPVVILLIAGIVDFGFKLNKIKNIANATRHGARIAASHSRTSKVDNGGVMAVCGPLTQGTCPPGGQEDILANDTVVTAARKAACNHLKSSSTGLNNWNVLAEVGQRSEDTLINQQIIRVDIAKIRENCYVCYDRIFDFFDTRHHNSFVLEESCLVE